MSSEDGRDDVRRVVTGRDWEGRDRRVVLQAVDGYVAMAIEKDDPVFLDPLLVSRAVRDLRDLQARALRGVRWDV
jgi:hypothetical protein